LEAVSAASSRQIAGRRKRRLGKLYGWLPVNFVAGRLHSGRVVVDN
jgi:hypothetical protein